MRVNLNRFFQVAVACAVAVLASSPAYGLAISEGFEGLAVGEQADPAVHGHITFTGSAYVTNAVDIDGKVVIEGSQLVKLGVEEYSQGTVSISAGSDPDNVWAVVYTIPGRSDEEYFGELDDETAFAFGVDTNGTIYATSDAAWEQFEINVPSNTWLAFAVNADYSAKTWDLYMSITEEYLDPMQKVAGGLLFNSNYTNTAMSELRVETSVLPAYVDGIFLQPALGTNLMVSPRYAGATIPIPPYTYNSPSNTFKVGSDLGDDLKAGFAANDKLRVFVDGDWYEYTLSGGEWDAFPVDGFPDVYPGNPISIQTLSQAGIALYPFSALPAPTATPLADSDTENFPSGWNRLIWPNEAKAADTSSQWGFSGVAVDYDRLIVFDNTTGRTQLLGWLSGGWKKFPHLTTPADNLIGNSQSFWFQRRGTTGGDPWTPPAE